VGGVGGELFGGLGDDVRDLIEVLEVGAVPGLADPVGDAAGRNGEADVVQRLEKVGADLVRAVLVADDGDLVVQAR